MKIEPNSVVTIHYTLTGEDGEVIDSSIGAEPLVYLADVGNIIPGLDGALMGLEVGATKQVTVPPEDGYGAYEDDLVQKLPTEMFGGIDTIEVGMSFEAQGEEGEVRYVEVLKVEEDGVTINANHELAGKVLNFDVSVEGIREASDTEIEHGHVH